MFYFNQKVILNSSNEILIYKNQNDGFYTFLNNCEVVRFSKNEVSKADFTEIFETVKLFGRTPIKRVLRATK